MKITRFLPSGMMTLKQLSLYLSQWGIPSTAFWSQIKLIVKLFTVQYLQHARRHYYLHHMWQIFACQYWNKLIFPGVHAFEQKHWNSLVQCVHHLQQHSVFLKKRRETFKVQHYNIVFYLTTVAVESAHISEGFELARNTVSRSEDLSVIVSPYFVRFEVPMLYHDVIGLNVC